MSSSNDETVVDVAWVARRLPHEVTGEGPLLAVDELAADKLLALFGRAAPEASPARRPRPPGAPGARPRGSGQVVPVPLPSTGPETLA